MKAIGIIAEYNPFHNGHLWQVTQAKKLTGSQAAIAVMSGSFLQRGEPASFDKWLRAKMAVQGGIDLVIELPAVFAIRSAQYFAAGGVRLLAELENVETLCFGAETANLEMLQEAAHSFENSRVLELFSTLIKEGHSYPIAFSRSISQTIGLNSDFLKSPNNILAIEYLRAIKQYAPQIKPLPIQRYKTQYHETEIASPFASATAIRRRLEKNSELDEVLAASLPIGTREAIAAALQSGIGPARFSALSPLLLYMLRTRSLKQLEALPEISEGLHFRLWESARQAKNLEELIMLVKTKRYPRVRIQRLLIHALLETSRNDLDAWDRTGPQYIRILAFNDTGRKLLKSIKERSKLPIITKTADMLTSRALAADDLSFHQKMLAVDTKASDLLALTLPNCQHHYGGWDFLRSPEYIPSALTIP